MHLRFSEGTALAPSGRTNHSELCAPDRIRRYEFGNIEDAESNFFEGRGVESPHVPARAEDCVADTGAAEAVAEAHPRAAMMFAMSVA